MRLKSFKSETKKQKYLFPWRFSEIAGFTLIETLITVSIMAVLATAVVYILQPAQFIVQSDDYTRVNDLETLDKAIKLSRTAGTLADTVTEAKKIYISLPDTDNDDRCNEYATLPSLVGGWEYRCMSDSAHLQNIDGSGWIPINLSVGQYISKLPIDPKNSSSSNNFYAYSWESKKSVYSLAAKLNSEKYVFEVAAKDGGNTVNVFEIRPIVWAAAPVVAPVSNTIGRVGEYNSIAIGDDNFPVISYYNTQTNTLEVAKCDNASCSGTNTIITTLDNTSSDVGKYTSIAIGTDSNKYPVISYSKKDGGDNHLMVARCINIFCTGVPTRSQVDPTTDKVGEYTSIAIGADTYPVISYYDKSNKSLKVAKCVNVSCIGANTITQVDPTTNSVGKYTSIAIGADTYPVISYYDETNKRLKVARCINTFCTGVSNINIVDDPSGGDVGEYTSIAIGADTYPVISYYDGYNNHLKVAKCIDVSCTGAPIITTVDNTYDVGKFSSIAISADTYPVISYYDKLHGYLKVVKCGNNDLLKKTAGLLEAKTTL